MHGGPKTLYKNAQHERAMNAPFKPKEEEYDMDVEKRAREAGL